MTALTMSSHNLGGVTTAETIRVPSQTEGSVRRTNALRRYNESPMRTADWCEYLAVVEKIEDRQKFVGSSPQSHQN